MMDEVRNFPLHRYVLKLRARKGELDLSREFANRKGLYQSDPPPWLVHWDKYPDVRALKNAAP
jgi:hypothetical protein